MSNPRKVTCQLMELADDGALSWEHIARAALCYLSESDVADMAHCNELIDTSEDDDE